MLSHMVHLFGSELARLAENRLARAYLAVVMKEPGIVDNLQLFRGQVHMLGNRFGVSGHTCGMACGQVVASVDRSSQGTYEALESYLLLVDEMQILERHSCLSGDGHQEFQLLFVKTLLCIQIVHIADAPDMCRGADRS